ncbi:MAG: phosphomannomutase/phosphoglucomutase [Myxococcota bacterium]|jgi:phosphomannomutase/phosphoglucomutase
MTAISRVPANVFRAYDVRGVVGTDLTAEFANLLGKAIGTMAKRQGRSTLSVGRDCRTHGPMLHEGLVSGLRSTGINILDIGVVTSPLVYFSLFHLEDEIDGGIVITGSHNPKEFNGFKICMGQTSIHGEDIQTLRALIEADDFETGEGGYSERSILRAYIDHVKGNLRLPHTNLKVVVDAGNGTAGPVIEPLLRELGFDVVALYCDMDGNFPNHHPDPTDEANLQDLIAAVAEHGAAAGFAYDGDTDRIGVVDDKGTILWGDRLMILLSRQLLSEVPGAAIVGEVKCSQTLFDDIAARGGRPILAKVGHSLIKARMKAEGAILAGEMSGHIFFKHRYFGYDDAVYATGRVLEVLTSHTESLSELMSDVPVTHVTPELRFDCPDDIKFPVVEHCVAAFKKTHKVIDIDGARVLFEDGWGLVRSSNTQPVLVLRCEAQTAEGLIRIRAAIEGAVETAIAAVSAEAG